MNNQDKHIVRYIIEFIVALVILDFMIIAFPPVLAIVIFIAIRYFTRSKQNKDYEKEEHETKGPEV